VSYSNNNADITEFLEVFRNMINKNSTNDQLLEYITDSFEVFHSSGILKDLLSIAASKDITAMVNIRAEEIREIIKEDMKKEYEAIKDEYEMKIADYELEYEDRCEAYSESVKHELQKQYNIRAMYNLAEEKFISDPDFRHEILNMMKNDLIKSKENGEFPKLFELTLRHCNEDEIYDKLLNSFESDLFEFYKPDMMLYLSNKHEEALMHEIKTSLYNDQQFINNAKKEIMKELAKTLFVRS
jgi:hypothetical protein